jgi:hypothetical protein
MSYCLLADLQNYLGTSASPDAALLQRMLDAATSRIDTRTHRNFYAAADSTRYHDYSRDQIINGELWLDGDLSYLTSITNGDGTSIATTSVFYSPRRGPAYAIGLKQSTGAQWTYGADFENSIGVTGRWAYMEKIPFTAIARVTGTSLVTATLANTAPVSVGQSIEVVGVADTGFNGTFTVTATTASTVVWSQAGATDTDTTGYILAAPQDIVHACRRLASFLYRQKDTQGGDIDRPLLTGDGSVVMPTTLPRDVELLLEPYTRVVHL